MKNPHAVALGRRGGLKGGPARAAALTRAERVQQARRGAESRWSSHRARAFMALLDDGKAPGEPVEEVLARGLGLARRRPDVARLWPVAFSRTSVTVDLRRLEALATRQGNRRVLGFFLELSGRLMNDPTMGPALKRLRKGAVRQPEQFFLRSRGVRAQALARRRTPALARKWCFWMNATVESFRSCFKKFAR
jgi:hypothetical protein